MAKFLVFQIGARMHYAVPEILERHGHLEALHTDIVHWDGGFDPLSSIVGATSAGRRYRGRVLSHNLARKTQEYRVRALWYLCWMHSRKQRQARLRVQVAQSRSLTLAVARSGFKGADSVYCHTTAGLELLREAKRHGIYSYLEQNNAAQTIGDRILEQVRREHIDWGMPGEDSFSNALVYDRVREEWELADTIVCPSQFVADSLISEGIDASKLAVVPYGAEASRGAPREVKEEFGRPLRLLFVGTVELRKGVRIIYEGWRLLPSGMAEIRFVGPVRVSDFARTHLEQIGEVVGQVPRPEVARLFEWADVLILPSFVEGSATVTYEALSNGIPVICSPNAGSIVEDGVTGLIVDPVPEQFAKAVRRIADDRAFFGTLQANAIYRRHEATIARYEVDLLNMISERGPKHDH